MSDGATFVPDPSNAEQARAWNEGDDGRRWATHADRLDLAVAAYGEHLRDAAALAIADRVLDIGCGAGRTTIDAARAAAMGSVLGVDLSAQALEIARARARTEGITNVEFAQADAQIHPFEAATFDVAISRFGAMFFGDPVTAFRNVARAVVPTGRLVLLTWQPFAEQEWLRTFAAILAAGRDRPPPPVDVPGPFGLSNPARVRAILGDAGFANVTVDDVHAPMWFGATADDALTFVSSTHGWMLDGVDADARARALDALRESVGEHTTPDGVRYGSSAWLVHARKR